MLSEMPTGGLKKYPFDRNWLYPTGVGPQFIFLHFICLFLLGPHLFLIKLLRHFFKRHKKILQNFLSLFPRGEMEVQRGCRNLLHYYFLEILVSFTTNWLESNPCDKSHSPNCFPALSFSLDLFPTILKRGSFVLWTTAFYKFFWETWKCLGMTALTFYKVKTKSFTSPWLWDLQSEAVSYLRELHCPRERINVIFLI